MILLPIGRDESTIQRHAWISYSIIALNIIAFFAVNTISGPNRAEARQAMIAALTFLQEHPYLEVPESLTRVVPADLIRELKSERVEIPSASVREQEQAQFDELAATAVSAYHQLPSFRFGFVPAEERPVTIVTSMFLHGGLLHLLGNMLFFYLSGPFVEDVFGRPVFAALYLTGGVAATFTYWVQHPSSWTPLIGASGAIAAIMGAYLVRFAKSKIEFLFIPLWFRPTYHMRFFVPAFVVLPLWFVQQGIEMQSEASSGVAFSAHVGGFLFGAAAAGIIRFTRYEEKVVAPIVEAETSWHIDPHLDQAMAARDSGDYAAARQEIAAYLAGHPQDLDGLRTAVDIARRADDDGMLDVYGTRLLTRFIQTGATEEAVDIVREVMLRPDYAKIPRLAARAALFCEHEGHRDWALTLYEKLVRSDPGSASSIGSMLKIGNLRKGKGDFAGARQILEEARAHPACSAEIARAVTDRLAELG